MTFLKKTIKWSNDNQGLIAIATIIGSLGLVAFGVWWAGLIVVLLLIVFYFISHESVPKSTTHDLSPETKSTSNLDQEQKTEAQFNKRIIVDVTPKYLVGLFHKQTDIQAQKLADTFIGKWIKVSGPLGNVGVFTTFSQVTFVHDPSWLWDGSTYSFSIYMIFQDRQYVEDRLAVLKTGDQITVLGKINRIDKVSVQLENCELLGANK